MKSHFMRKIKKKNVNPEAVDGIRGALRISWGDSLLHLLFLQCRRKTGMLSIFLQAVYYINE
jgi:hypothetical protein